MSFLEASKDKLKANNLCRVPRIVKETSVSPCQGTNNNLTPSKGNGRYRGLEVPLIEPRLIESTIKVKKWKLGSSISYTLGSQWQQVANNNGLHVDLVIHSGLESRNLT
jgi:hypothetical protein